MQQNYWVALSSDQIMKSNSVDSREAIVDPLLRVSRKTSYQRKDQNCRDPINSKDEHFHLRLPDYPLVVLLAKGPADRQHALQPIVREAFPQDTLANHSRGAEEDYLHRVFLRLTKRMRERNRVQNHQRSGRRACYVVNSCSDG